MRMGSALLSRLPPHPESRNPTVARPAIPVMNELQAGAPLHDFLVLEDPAALIDKPRLSHRPKEYAIAVAKSVMNWAGAEYSQYEFLAKEETFRSN